MARATRFRKAARLTTNTEMTETKLTETEMTETEMTETTGQTQISRKSGERN
jgi:hypothetical protein